MDNQRTNGHTVSQLTVHVVLATNYRYAVLENDIKIRCRTLLIQICESEDVEVFSKVIARQEGNAVTAFDFDQKLVPGVHVVVGSDNNELFKKRIVIQ